MNALIQSAPEVVSIWLYDDSRCDSDLSHSEWNKLGVREGEADDAEASP